MVEKKTVSQVIVDFMRFLGIKYCFGIPGSNIDLFHEIAKNKNISVLLTKHESGAAFMANGFTKVSGIMSACFGSVGPGATNLVTGVAAAYEDSQPILVLTGQVPKSFHGRNAFQEAAGKGRTINQKEIFKNITRHCGCIYDKRDLLPELEKAYIALTNPRPGPAYLEIATDIMEESVEIPSNFFREIKNIKKIKIILLI